LEWSAIDAYEHIRILSTFGTVRHFRQWVLSKLPGTFGTVEYLRNCWVLSALPGIFGTVEYLRNCWVLSALLSTFETAGYFRHCWVPSKLLGTFGTVIFQTTTKPTVIFRPFACFRTINWKTCI